MPRGICSRKKGDIVREWNSRWNSFNSVKGLLYKPQYDAVLKGKFLPPVGVNLDPANACNLKCIWCNGKEVTKRNVLLSRQHFLELIRFFKEWGVKGLCIAGGGEPTIHPNLAEALRLAKGLGLLSNLMTNGLFRDTDQIQAVAECCEWVGVSIDCGLPGTYYKLKGKDAYYQACGNIRKLVAFGAKEVTYKFLLHPDNQHEVYHAIQYAKDLGCHGIHIRPVSFLNFQSGYGKYDVDAIDDQVIRGRVHEGDDFKIFYITHKADKDLLPVKNFKKCQASPVIGIFEANGDITMCIDRKNDKSMVIGSHTDISKIKDVWGSDKHKEIMRRVDVSKCPKCTISTYNEIVENVIEDNKMNWQFP